MSLSKLFKSVNKLLASECKVAYELYHILMSNMILHFYVKLLFWLRVMQNFQGLSLLNGLEVY